ncbi:uncharacterized protein [Medicago truncatula]|uniref:Sister chromatid cohesion PDS5-like protein n=2 Tax=Medicago truncatula TaxID=3880 RepID=A0A072UFL3_MEDTR|nr:uncharacterized protein LOC25491183 isoform X2 [Medicago truncatula]KEH28544.1 sister chromatid cohesion PDS5-like protein [Medicago truncatula]
MASSDDRDTVVKSLRHLGRKLSKNLASSVDILLELLDKMELLLLNLDQNPPEPIQESLVLPMKTLISDELLKHTDEDVKISVTACLTEIARITAPNDPYDDENMKEFFKLTVAAFENLSHVSGRRYEKALTILEKISKIKIFLIMLDLECDDLVIEMFQQFLRIIRSNHPSSVIESMEIVMTGILDESEDISSDLLRPLLDSVRKENQTISPISWTLGEKVITNCAVKLKPYLMKAVESSGRALNEYAETITSICHNKSESPERNHSMAVQDVENNLDIPKDAPEEPCDVTTGVEMDNTCVRDVQITDETKSDIRSTNAATVDDEVTKSSDSKRKLHSCPTTNSERRNAKTSSETGNLESDQELNSKTQLDTVPRKRARKPNSLMNPEEGYNHSFVHKQSSTRKSSQSNKKAHDDSYALSPSDNPSSRKDKTQSKPETVGEAPVSDLKNVKIAKSAKSKKTCDMSGNGPSIESLDSTKSIRPSNPEGMTKTPEALVSDLKNGKIAKPAKSKKDCDKSSDVPCIESPDSTKGIRTSNPEGMSKTPEALVSESKQGENRKDVPFTKDIIHEGSSTKQRRRRKISSIGDQNDHPNSASILKDDNLNPSHKKTSVESHGVGKKNKSKVRKDSEEKHEAPVGKIKLCIKFDGKVVVPPQSIVAKVESEVLCEDEKKHKSSTNTKVENRAEGGSSAQIEVDKRKRKTSTSDKGVNKSSAKKAQESEDLGNSLVGKRIKVWWPLDKTYYEGAVSAYDHVNGKHKVLYDDGVEEQINLKKHRWELADVNVSPDKGRKKRRKSQVEVS